MELYIEVINQISCQNIDLLRLGGINISDLIDNFLSSLDVELVCKYKGKEIKPDEKADIT